MAALDIEQAAAAGDANEPDARSSSFSTVEPLIDFSAFSSALEAGGDRKAILSDALEKGRAAVREHFETKKLAGIDSGIALSSLQDQLVEHIFAGATKAHPLAHPTKSERIAVVAVGGYGRGMLAPGSDIDLLFLTPYKRAAWVENVAETMLYELWDLGQKIGQATRSIDECVSLARNDFTIRTSLLETRLLCGDAELYEELQDRLWSELFAATAAEFAQQKLEERSARHIRVGNSRYMLEPNIKEGKGALRDLHSLFWIAKYTYQVGTTRELVEKGVLTAGENRRFESAERFLWTVRFWLHYFAGRAQEQLTFEHQILIAEAMGFVGDSGLSAVERFMMRYFSVAKEVGDLTRIFCATLESQSIAKKRRSAWKFTELFGLRSANENKVAVQHGRILVEDAEFFRRAPVEMLRVFLDTARAGASIHPTTLKVVRRNIGLVDDALRANPEANQIFLDLLCETADPEKSLRWLSEAGVLGRFMPEFGEIICMMQFNMYHHYTVDEHTIQAVGNLRAIEDGELKEEAPLVTGLMSGPLERRVLYIALLLHDIGKGRPEDHSVLGAEIAQTVCPRLGLSEQETESVVWLVRQHLLMSDVAQRRDLSDPKTIQAFAEQVQTLERLNMLLIVTVCDIRAVGPGTWTSWKAQLLRDLFNETRTLLSAGHEGVAESRKERIEAAKTELRGRLADWSEAEFENFASRHYPPYWLGLDADTHENHAKMLRSAKPDALIIDTETDDARSGTRLSVAMGDHPGFFSRITGAVVLSGVSIVEAQTFTTSDGLALATIWIQERDGSTTINEDRRKRLSSMMHRVMQGEVLPHIAIEEREESRIEHRERNFSVPPRVAFDNSASDLFTVVEVTGRDRMGLLHDLARAITTQRANIFSAVIATYGERAVDSFYVKDFFGHKITGEKHQKAIEAALMEALKEPQDSDQPETGAVT